MQLLEGDEADVHRVFERICGDSRHDHIQLDLVLEADDRLLQEWAMAYVEYSAELHILTDRNGCNSAAQFNPFLGYFTMLLETPRDSDIIECGFGHRYV